MAFALSSFAYCLPKNIFCVLSTGLKFHNTRMWTMVRVSSVLMVLFIQNVSGNSAGKLMSFFCMMFSIRLVLGLVLLLHEQTLIQNQAFKSVH